ncbi:MAG TPA: ester cyclase [Anaerolineae bacterium]|nr:ester cyclase [Anaerolineae bacterium]
MSVEQNKAGSRRFFEEVWGKGNLAVIDELTASSFVDHNAAPGLPPGVEGLKQFVTLYRTGFPDMQVTVDDLIAEGDKVVIRWTARGVNTGPLFGMPATGKSATVTGITIERKVDGMTVEGWNNFDQVGMLQQLGVAPAPA